MATDEAEFQLLASDLIGRFFILVKVARIHDMGNAAVVPVVERFRAALEMFQQTVGANVAVQFVGDAAYVNKRLIHADLSTWERATFLKDFLAKVGMAEIAFMGDVPDGSVRQFVQAIRDLALDASRKDEVHGRSFPGIKFRDIDASAKLRTDFGIKVSDKMRVLRAYGILLVTIRQYFDAIQTGPATLLPVRRAAQELARLPARTLPLQLGLMALPHHREEPAGRAARVAAMSILMGRRIGVRVGLLRDAGAAAAVTFLARLGKAETFAPAHRLAEQEAHLGAVRMMAKAPLVGRGAAIRILATLNQSTAEGRVSGHPLSRIVAAADAYDLLTVPPPYGPGLVHDDAIRRMAFEPDIDPATLRLLAATFGMFPVGSIVRLSDGCLALVVDVTGDARRMLQPRVRVLTDPQGQPVDLKVIDLIGSSTRIEGTVNPADADFNVGNLLYSEPEASSDAA